MNSSFLEKTGVIAGVDEVGRGPLAGPVVAALVVLDNNDEIAGLRDSKMLSENRRETLSSQIHSRALAVSIGSAEPAEIDDLNILQATLLAMQRAISSVHITPDLVLVDGIHCPDSTYMTRAITGGDSSIPAISAASIVAKVYRDRIMMELDDEYPGYGFSRNKGYPTSEHLNAIKRIGITPVHRRSFKPVSRYEA